MGLKMDCMQIRKKLVQYIEGLLTEEETALMDNHLEKCETCNQELADIKDIRNRLVLSGRHNRSIDLEDRIIDRIICEQNKRLNQTVKPNPWLKNWRSIMKSRITKLSAAAVAVVAVMITISLFNRSVSTATAEGVLSDAVKAVSGLNSVHMKARMRTEPGDNFASIGLIFDFVPIEMWMQIENGKLRWRVEKPRRILVMDGETTTLFTRPNETSSHAYKLEVACPLGRCFDSWMGRLLDVQELLDSELQQAKDKPDRQIRLIHEEINDKDKIILEVDLQTDIPADDYLRNKFLSEADSLKVYRFDSETKLLEDFKVYVIDKGQEVLVFEITDIEYNAEIDDNVFVLDLPEDVIWLGEPQILPDNEKYSRMTPREVAAAFFDAISKGDWNEANKYTPKLDESQDFASQEIKDEIIGLEVIYLGEPFQSEMSPIHWFVPYKIRFKNGEIKEWNLALRNDNKAERYIVDGGF